MGATQSKTIISMLSFLLVLMLVPGSLMMTGCDDNPAGTTDTLTDTVVTSGIELVGVVNFDDEKGTNVVTGHFLDGTMSITHNIFHDFGWDVTAAAKLIKFSSVDSQEVKDSIIAKMDADNAFDTDAGVTRDGLTPTSGGAAFSSLKDEPAASFWTDVDYKGAFGTSNWLADWTYYAGDTAGGGAIEALPTKTFVDSMVKNGTDYTMSADTVYILEGFVFVEDGATLTIDSGTVIKARAGGGLNASALIICRGGTINAVGTASKPIIITAQIDDLRYRDDINSTTRGLWGGLIVLGKASTNRAAGTEQIEGITATDSRGEYGGSTDNDNSGTIQYVSIRYGGTNIGEGNEINGLTMGGVGSGTTIDHVEVYNNSDDGFEFFGGSVNTKYMCAVGCGDDSFDWDEGFNGNGQFWCVIQSSDMGDRAMECDGCASDNRGSSDYSNPTLYNCTFIGSGSGSGNEGNMAFKFREETSVSLHNSIITDFAGDLSLSN